MPKSVVPIFLSDDDKSYLKSILQKGTVEARVYKRARILMLKSEGMSDEVIADKLDITRPTVNLCLKKYMESGVHTALEDSKGRGRKIEISKDAKEWVVHIASRKPSAFGLPAELWYPLSLTRYINSIAEQEGYSRMATVSEFSIRKILREALRNPQKVLYYCERRNPEFQKKVHYLLVVYKQIRFYYDENADLIPLMENAGSLHTLSECSLLAAIDLLIGEVVPMVGSTDTGSDFRAFLKILDEKYPKEGKIQLILDSPSAYTSEEVQKYVDAVPGRFEFVFYPSPGFWLDMTEGFFSKMMYQMLSGLRVKSQEELRERILKYFDEINAVPVPCKWKCRTDTGTIPEAVNKQYL